MKYLKEIKLITVGTFAIIAVSGLLSVNVALAATVWRVPGDGSNTCMIADSSCATIGAAVTAAAPGDTVKVSAGTYTEQVVINKSLTLTGAGEKSTFIKASSTLALDSFGNHDIVAISGPATVNMSGFTIEGPGPSGCDSIDFGIFVSGAAVANLNNNIVSNVQDTPFSGCQNGVAIQVGRNSQSTTGVATITNNTIVGYQKNGITIDNTGSSATITGNTVTGAGQTTVTAQNGIQISRGATATVTNNQITGDSYVGPSACPDENYFAPNCYQAGGVLLYDAAPTTVVSNNRVSSSDVGIWAYDDNSVTTPYAINDDTLLNNYGYGIVFDSVNGTSTDNLFENNPVGLLVTDYSASSDVTSINDQFLKDAVNNEALEAAPGSTLSADLIVETTGLGIHFPLFPIFGPHTLHFR